MNLDCPRCHSDSTQKVSAIVASGTEHTVGRAQTNSQSRGTSTSMGVSFGPGGMSASHSLGRSTVRSVANTTHASTTRSELAQKLAAPPRKPENRVLVLLLMLLPALLLAWIPIGMGYAVAGVFGEWVAIGGLGAGAYFLFKKLAAIDEANREYNRTIWAEQKAQWDQSFFCHRCEYVFTPSATASALESLGPESASPVQANVA